MESGNEEALDVKKLHKFLCEHKIVESSDITIEQFHGGSSNLTYLISLDDNKYVLRRAPFGNTVVSAHNMRREYEVLEKLSAVFPAAPKPYFFCYDTDIIGDEFYLMEYCEGLILRGKMPASQNIDHDAAVNICRSFIKKLVELHSIDPDNAGLGGLYKGDGYTRRQVEGWTSRYFNAKTDEHPELEDAFKWLNDNIPEDSGIAIIHNDYKFDNVMLDPKKLTSITAVLDWEMVTVGDPLMDLGTTLGYWMSPDADNAMLDMPFNPRLLMENVSRQQLAEMYVEMTGRDISDIHFYYIFGLLKIAVIAQQIYARYVKGFTKDERFAGFARSVAALGQIANKAVEDRSI